MNGFTTISTIAQVHQLLQLKSPAHSLVSVIDNDELCLEPGFWQTRYVLDLYIITLKSTASGSFGYGRNVYDFQAGTLLFISPGQVVSPGEISKLSAFQPGWTLVFHPDLIRKGDLGSKIESYSFFSYEVQEALHLSDMEKTAVNVLVERVKEEYSQRIDRHTQGLIVSTIELLLDYCTRYFDRQFYTRTNFHKDIVTQFEQLLKSFFLSDRPQLLGIPTVQYCSHELGLSPGYLSDLLKKEVGRSAQDYIHFYVVEKAKTALLRSADPVSQIAYALGFEYPQHFSKIFKTKTGLSPSEYRNLN